MDTEGTVDEKRLVATFVRLVRMDSPSKKEGRVADYLEGELKRLGLEVGRDDAGKGFGGETGNVAGYLAPSDGRGRNGLGADDRGPGGSAHGTIPLFCAHMDTVRSAADLEPRIEGGVIRSDGRNILGADDKAGVAAILEALEVLKAGGRPHGAVRVLFTAAEEIGLFGAVGATDDELRADHAFVMDSGSPVGTIIVDTPTEIDLTVAVHGRTAHAGVEPEKGINAIHVAAKAIASLPTGRIDAETTMNFGVISGGGATNVVPEDARVEIEARSRDLAKLDDLVGRITGAFHREGEAAGAEVRVEKKEAYKGFKLGPQDDVVRLASAAVRRLGLEPTLSPRGGGSDANILNARRLPAVNLGAGYQDDHTAREYIPVEELVRAARLVLALVDVAAGHR